MGDSLGSSTADRRVIRVMLLWSFGITIGLAIALLASRGTGRVVLLAQLGLFAGVLLAQTWLGHAGRPGNWLVSLGVLNLVVGGPELLLRIADFRWEAGVQFGFPSRTDFVRFAPHPQLFWTYASTRPGVNSWGLHDDEVVRPKPRGVFRIAFLGDSCTDLGDPGYPARVEHILNHRYGGRGVTFESVVLAVSGYSSHQGRVLAETYAPSVAADVAFVYYGWNDHWQAYGAVDADKVVQADPRAQPRLVERLYETARVLQLGRWVIDRSTRTGRATPTDRVRVPPEHYRDNLTRIERAFRGAGAASVMITAPTSWYRLGVPDRYVVERYVPDKQTAADRHRAYNEIAREVATGQGARLLDLEAELDTTTDLATIMYQDGVHFSDAGLDHLAARLVRFLEVQKLLPTGAGPGWANP